MERTPVTPASPGGGPAAADGALARVVALVPVRGLEHAKTRLGIALDAEERAALAASLTRRTLRALADARVAGDVDEIVVASPDPAALAEAVEIGAIPLTVSGRDLVADLRTARERAVVAGATAVLVVPIDLARVSGPALGGIVAAGRRALVPGLPLVVLVPDRAGEGSNVLLVAPPRAIDFAFGPGSRGRHAAAARSAGAILVELGGPLDLDVDTPEDLADAEGLDAAEGGAAPGRLPSPASTPAAARGQRS